MIIPVSLALQTLCFALSCAKVSSIALEATAPSQPTTRRYTTCGPYTGGGRALPSPTASLEPASNVYHPLVAFFFTKEGLRDPGIAAGITKFFERYAECGLSRFVVAFSHLVAHN